MCARFNIPLSCERRAKIHQTTLYREVAQQRDQLLNAKLVSDSNNLNLVEQQKGQLVKDKEAGKGGSGDNNNLSIGNNWSTGEKKVSKEN